MQHDVVNSDMDPIGSETMDWSWVSYCGPKSDSLVCDPKSNLDL